MDKPINILHLEDDPTDAELIRETLASGSIASKISRVQTKEEFSESLKGGGFDIILSDYKLPMFDGISAMRMAQECCPDIPFIFVSGTLGEDAAIRTLTQGATDYVLKSRLSRIAPAVKRAFKEIKNRRERTRIESIMKVRLRILEAVYTKDLSLDEICVMFLDEIESQTGSEIGFFSFVKEDQKTVVLQSWSSNTTATMCTAEGKGSHYNISEAGVWTDCIRQRKPVIHNDYISLPHRKGLPKGHAPVVRELVVPVIRGDLIVAVIGVGNKRADYDETDVQIVSLMGDFSWEIIRRKRMEESLRESEERYRSLVELAPEAIVVHVNGIISYGNAAAAKLYGSDTFDRFIGKNVLEFVHPDSLEIVKERARKSYEKRMPGEPVEEKHVRLDGQTIRTEVTTVPISFSGEKATLLIISDVTERKQAEERIVRERENFYKILESAPVGLLLVDGERIIKQANNVIGAMVLRDPAEIIGKRAGGGLGCIHSLEDPRGCGFSKSCPDCSLRLGLETGIVEGKSIYGKEITLGLMIGGNLQERWLNVNVEPVMIDDLKYLIVAIDDITEKKQMEQERLANLSFLEGMDRINRAMQGTNDLDQMMGNLLDVMLSIFKCDRVWLINPCDPESETWHVEMERTNPEYPGLGIKGVMQMDPEGARTFRLVLDADGPVQFGPGSGQLYLPPVISELSNIKSYIAMAIYPKVGKPWEFGMHQCSYARIWTAEEERLFQEIGRRFEDSLTTLLMYREVQTLLRELYHRTKNNMAVIVSFLEIQSRYFDDPRWHQALNEARGRIRSMALVHQKLYETKELSRVNLKQYIGDLTSILMTSYNLSFDRIAIDSKMDDVFVEIDYAVPCGLILNELITNALKYAFPGGRKGVIKIKLRRTDIGEIFLSVSDDGVGVPAGFMLRRDGRMGMEIIYGLTEFQLKGQLQFDTQQGVNCQIVFSDNLYRKRV